MRSALKNNRLRKTFNKMATFSDVVDTADSSFIKSSKSNSFNHSFQRPASSFLLKSIIRSNDNSPDMFDKKLTNQRFNTSLPRSKSENCKRRSVSVGAKVKF